MKLSAIFLLLFAFAYAGVSSSDAACFGYVSDRSAFNQEQSVVAGSAQARALRLAKAYLSHFLDQEIRGTFSVAEADWGFQVNFTGLKKRKGEAWVSIDEGFGEVFISKDFTRMQLCYGP